MLCSIGYEAITAWATLAAVLVALFLEPLRRWWHAPKIKLGIRKRDVTLSIDHAILEVYPKLYIYNHGRGVAQKVFVTLTTIFVLSPQGYEMNTEPVATDLKWMGFGTTCLDLLPGRTARFAELGKVKKVPTGTDAKHFLVIARSQGQHQLIEGDYVFRIVVSGANFRAKSYLIRIIVGPRRPPNQQYWFSVSWPESELLRAVKDVEKRARLEVSLK